MHSDLTFYDILGVQPSASAQEIKAAYRAAVLKYHPDVNSAPNAQRLTAIIIEAYATLSDTAKRGAYDAALRSGSPHVGPEDEREEIWDLYACDGCGNVEPHLRYALFYRVWSIVIYTQMRGEGGVLCPKCRSKFAISTALFSAFLGPWGLPWGILYTLRSLFASLRAGELPKQQNGQLLRHQGIAFLQRGLINQARTALNASLWFEKNESVTTMVNGPVFFGSTVEPVTGWQPGQTVAAFLFLVPPVIVVILLFALGMGSSGSTQSTANNRIAPNPQQSAQAAQLDALIDACNKADKKNADLRAVYDACGKAIRWLSDDATKSQNGSEDQQYYSITADYVRERQSYGAMRLGLEDESKRIDAQIDTSLKSLISGGVTAAIRSKAQSSYNCYFKNVCNGDKTAAQPTGPSPAATATAATKLAAQAPPEPVLSVDPSTVALEGAAISAGSACQKDAGHDTPDAQEISDCSKAVAATKKLETQQHAAGASQRDLDAISIMISLELYGLGSSQTHAGNAPVGRAALVEARERAREIVNDGALDSQDLKVAKTLINSLGFLDSN